MELAFLLRSVGTEVFWITIQKPSETDEVVYSLEQKMLVRGVQVITVLAPEVVQQMIVFQFLSDFNLNIKSGMCQPFILIGIQN